METEEIKKLQSSLADVQSKMDKMYYALMGNELAKDGGLVGRIIELEKGQESLEMKIDTNYELLRKELESYKTAQTKSDIYVHMMWALGSAALTAIIIAIINLVFKH